MSENHAMPTPQQPANQSQQKENSFGNWDLRRDNIARPTEGELDSKLTMSTFTANEDAEKFNSTSLLYEKNVTSFIKGRGSGGTTEAVTVYGIEDGSKYVAIGAELNDGEVYISSAFKDKFGFDTGDKITLSEEFANKSYEFTVSGIVDYEGGIAVFMPNDNFISVFDNEFD